ncbi:hypothetical protein L211DRAFT_779699 [Terfezia boudieri ATCC MYA-4762]|uniref:Uncharacterized protein n=1 Tax=Terfezia boudieri ATCC MYA-4762 TaxID=1051890 RepID=A0A3N4LXV7_9PEZI|nr:hypothetical protein L211DRAFT_779699 [Terfezia boudieri ATCC MYA-4762]
MSQSTTTASTKSQLLPRFLQPDQIKSFLPSFSFQRSTAPKQKKEWNPYTFFIWAFLLVGSQGINMIALKHDHRDFMRRAGSRIDLLREVIEKIERGEEVDVSKMLGARVESEEKGWEDVLKEIEQEDLMWQERKVKKQAKGTVNGEDKFAVSEAVEQKPRPVEKIDDSTFL